LAVTIVNAKMKIWGNRDELFPLREIVVSLDTDLSAAEALGHLRTPVRQPSNASRGSPYGRFEDWIHEGH
jgi:hypothetical protein